MRAQCGRITILPDVKSSFLHGQVGWFSLEPPGQILLKERMKGRKRDIERKISDSLTVCPGSSDPIYKMGHYFLEI